MCILFSLFIFLKIMDVLYLELVNNLVEFDYLNRKFDLILSWSWRSSSINDLRYLHREAGCYLHFPCRHARDRACYLINNSHYLILLLPLPHHRCFLLPLHLPPYLQSHVSLSLTKPLNLTINPNRLIQFLFPALHPPQETQSKTHFVLL